MCEPDEMIEDKEQRESWVLAWNYHMPAVSKPIESVLYLRDFKFHLLLILGFN